MNAVLKTNKLSQKESLTLAGELFESYEKTFGPCLTLDKAISLTEHWIYNSDPDQEIDYDSVESSLDRVEMHKTAALYAFRKTNTESLRKKYELIGQIQELLWSALK